MASELLKRKSLINRLKEPDVPVINFDLIDSAKDYNIESIEENILPEPKPQELLDLQEQNRKQRLSDSLQKIGSGLMDESVDFIKREEFDKGSRGPGRPVGDKGGRPSLADQEKFYEDILKAYNKLKKELGRNPTQGELLRATGRKSQTAIRTAEKKFGLKFFNKPGEYNVPREVLQKIRKKQAEEARAKKIITQPTTFQEEGVLKKVRFPNKKMEDAFKANVKLYHSFPQGSSEAKKVGATLDSFKQFYPDGVSDEVLRRHVAFFRNKLNLKFPKQEYEGQLKTQKIVNKRRENLIKEVSGFLQERQIGKAKRELGFGRTGENLDLAHRASLKQFKDFGLDYLADNLGLDTRKVNQEILPPLEKEISSLHRKRMRLIKGIEPGNVPKEVSKQLEDINIKLSNISMKTNGALQAVLLDEKNLKPFVFNKNYANVIGQGLIDKPVKELTEADIEFISKTFPSSAKQAKAMKIPTAEDSKNIAKQLASFGFKCSASEGGACDNPMNYLDDIKKQQVIATGSGKAATDAAKKLNAGRAIFREVLGPAALGFELAAAVPITYLGYKAGLPPARIISDATYGLAGDTETARLKKIAVKEGIDTADIQKALDFEKATGAMQTLAAQEQDFRGPDDEMLFPQQYEKGEEDFYKAVGAFRDKEGNISKDVFQTISDQLNKIRGIASEEDAERAAEREADIDRTGIGDYLTTGIIPQQENILDVFDFQEPSTRMDLSEGGPNNPSRRTFLKFMAGIASLPFVGKFFKGAKSAKVVKLANTTTTMPEWFPAFVDRAFEKGIAKKVDADLTELTIPELPGVKVEVRTDGKVRVEGKNAYDEPYQIEYEPPGYEVLDYETGQTVRTKGDFEAVDTQFRRTGPEIDDYDVDYETVKDVDDILGGDSTKLEGFAKGTGETKYTKGQKDIDMAEAEGTRADVDEGPDIDLSDYED